MSIIMKRGDQLKKIAHFLLKDFYDYRSRNFRRQTW